MTVVVNEPHASPAQLRLQYPILFPKEFDDIALLPFEPTDQRRHDQCKTHGVYDTRAWRQFFGHYGRDRRHSGRPFTPKPPAYPSERYHSETRPRAVRGDRLPGSRAGLRTIVRAREWSNGNPVNEKPIFESRCPACHAFNGAGRRLGPDLTGIRNHPVDAICCTRSSASTRSRPGTTPTSSKRETAGRSGAAGVRGANSLTLRDASSQPDTILRTDVVTMAASRNS